MTLYVVRIIPDRGSSGGLPAARRLPGFFAGEFVGKPLD
jgi:hypothetical protein